MKRKLLISSSLAVIVIVLTIYLQSCKREPVPLVYRQENDSLFVQLDNAVIVASNVNKSEIVFKTVDSTKLKNAKYLGKKTIRDYLTITDKEKKNSYFYVVNYEGGGYSIISADKREMPILGYSDNGHFSVDSMPDGLVRWLESHASMIKNFRNKNSKQSTYVAYKWSTLSCDQPILAERSPLKSTEVNQCSAPPTPPGGSYSGFTVGPLTTTQWYQDCGYNTYCPYLNYSPTCYHAYTGCSTTAIAQVMYYWKYPSFYNWNAMSTFSSDATAKLMGDIFPWVITPTFSLTDGGVTSNYGTGGSSCSNDYNIIHCFKNGFNYSSATLSGWVNGINENGGFNWNAIRTNLLAKWPVIIGGYTDYVNILGVYSYASGKGHTWVCDGYMEGTYTDGSQITMMVNYHMNWGWQGKYNGWYNGDAFNTPNGNYNYFTDMIYNIHP
jgi:hypothetical protein